MAHGTVVGASVATEAIVVEVSALDSRASELEGCWGVTHNEELKVKAIGVVLRLASAGTARSQLARRGGPLAAACVLPLAAGGSV